MNIVPCVFPANAILEEALKFRGVAPSDKSPNMMHYLGNSEREMRSEMKRREVDFVVIHSPRFDRSNIDDLLYAYDPCSHPYDILAASNVVTNAPELAQIYYGRLGINKTLVKAAEHKDVPKAKPLTRVASWLKRFEDFMMW